MCDARSYLYNTLGIISNIQPIFLYVRYPLNIYIRLLGILSIFVFDVRRPLNLCIESLLSSSFVRCPLNLCTESVNNCRRRREQVVCDGVNGLVVCVVMCVGGGVWRRRREYVIYGGVWCECRRH